MSSTGPLPGESPTVSRNNGGGARHLPRFLGSGLESGSGPRMDGPCGDPLRDRRSWKAFCFPEMRFPGYMGLLVALAAGAGLLWVPGVHVLELSSAASGKDLWCTRVKEGEEFLLSFTHSVNRRPVHETLRIQGGRLVIVGSRFDSFGAGMPEASTDEGNLTILPDGWLQWTVNRPVPEIVVRVGRIAGQTLTVGGQSISLADLAEPGQGIVFRVGRRSLFHLLKGRCSW